MEAKDNRCILTIAVPFFLEGLKVGPGAYELIREYPYHQTTTCTANVRLDLFGHEEVQLPHEPLFCTSDIETRIDENTSKGVQTSTKTKWVVAEKIIASRRLRATPGDVINTLLQDLKDAVFGGNQPRTEK